MGACFPIPRKRPDCVDVLLVGPADAGKTSILNRLVKLNHGTTLLTMPTTGLNVDTIRCRPSPDREGGKELWMRLWDLGSVVGMEQLWRGYLPICHAVVFVIDSKACGSPQGAEETKRVLDLFLMTMKAGEKEELPVYVMANKQDLENRALTADQISSALCLPTVLKKKTWDIGEISAKDGSGLLEAVNWIISQTENQ